MVVGILKTIDKNSFISGGIEQVQFSFQSDTIYAHILIDFALPVFGLLVAWSYITHRCYNHCDHLPGIKAIRSSTRVNMCRKVSFTVIPREPRLCCHPDHT